jgi:glycosyltransferase involved in cell wall biosynthesis
MEISLCLLVKDEERTLEDCLGPIHDLFDDIAVMDTGSTDRTCELLRDRFHIVPCHGRLDEKLCYPRHEARNQLIELSRHPCVFFLDADERITREDAVVLRALPDDPAVSGYFCRWDTITEAGSIEDYKLPLFRRTTCYRGLVHENAQQDLRRRGGTAAWLRTMALVHYPEWRKRDEKSRYYRNSLRNAIEREPEWFRYHWFLGHALYRDGDTEAVRWLEITAASRSCDFPVECLNSHLLLAEILAGSGAASRTKQVLEAGLAFYDAVRDDFEVRVNFRLPGALAQMLEAARTGRLNEVRAYKFPY